MAQSLTLRGPRPCLAADVAIVAASRLLLPFLARWLLRPLLQLVDHRQNTNAYCSSFDL